MSKEDKGKFDCVEIKYKLNKKRNMTKPKI